MVPFAFGSSPTFVVISFLDDSHSNKTMVESKHGFDFHFFYGQQC
jgi:hypothetical protein